jgi:transposase-like protein
MVMMNMNEQAVIKEEIEGSGPMGPERSEGPIGPRAAERAQGTTLRVASDPEVNERPVRRRFSAEYKLRIVEQADVLRATPGAIGELLRREGLYSSHLTNWRAQRDSGALHALTPKKRGRKPDENKELARKMAKLEAQNRRLQKRLENAELIIEVQKKLGALLRSPEETPELNGSAE